MTDYFKSKTQEISFISIILLALIAFYIETDIYTPSFPEMMTYFGTNEDTIQLLLSVNFLGLCASSLFLGPASDAYGRKPVLCAGLSIFMLGSIGCALTDSLNWMIAFRFLQGVGCGSIVSAGITLFFDVYPPDRSSRLVSICNGTISGMMALAPMIGNYISLHFGWRANFYLIAILATVSCLSIWFFLNETLPREKRTQLRLSTVFTNYARLLSNFPFMAHSCIWCLSFSSVIVFIANLSLIFVDYLHVSAEVFGYYQAVIMGTFFVGSMSGAYFIKKIGMLTTKLAGSIAFVVGVAILAVLALLNIESPLVIIIAMAIASLGSALAITIYFTYSMAYLDNDLKGSAMALTQSLRLFMSSGLVWLAARAFDGSIQPVAVVAGISTVFCIVLYAALYVRDQHRSGYVEGSITELNAL